MGELGFDAAVDRTTGDLGEALREVCPDGIDVYFDNVGGAVLDAALGSMALFGRVAVCGC
ncbi:zinc-binding dehydrogenase [Amycolatopsis thermoflava]|uniref:zinc-binding dehydrogenase n=1 Tax=Amycolatopsis thermoflava TaxID=84480 RepID=UPI003802A0B6